MRKNGRLEEKDEKERMILFRKSIGHERGEVNERVSFLSITERWDVWWSY